MNQAFDYVKEANVTASNNFHGHLIPVGHFNAVITNAIEVIGELDKIKKALFYGRQFNLPKEYAIAGGWVAMRGAPTIINAESPATGELILHSIVGKATECGELLELLRDVLFYQKPFDAVNFIEEIGDGQWYDAVGAKAVGVTFEELQRRNIAKLRHRFPEKFTEHDANNRDLFGERKILEMHQRQTEGKPTATIENWTRYGNVLIGDLRGHQKHGDMNGCRTSAIVRMDEAEGICETKNTIYNLGQPYRPIPRVAEEIALIDEVGEPEFWNIPNNDA